MGQRTRITRVACHAGIRRGPHGTLLPSTPADVPCGRSAYGGAGVGLEGATRGYGRRHFVSFYAVLNDDRGTWRRGVENGGRVHTVASDLRGDPVTRSRSTDDGDEPPNKS
jgi:hypothetical protein